MSNVLSTYIGPYARTISPMVACVHKVRTCSNAGCAVRQRGTRLNSPFCHQCGHAVADLSVPGREPAVDAGELREEVDDALAHWTDGDDGAYIWTPNCRRSAPRDFHVDPRTVSGALDLSAASQGEVLWFSGAFGAELSLLSRTYGPSRLSIMWGLVWMTT